MRKKNNSKNRAPSFTIMFPFLNDWGTVGSLVALAISTVSAYTDDWEVVIVNDGSNTQDREALGRIVHEYSSSDSAVAGESRSSRQDGYRTVTRQARTIKNRIRIIDHKKNRGYGGALQSGFAAASKDLIFYTDCDAQYDPRELSLLIEKMPPFAKATGGETGMVNGYKIKRLDPWYRVIAGRVYHYVVKFAFTLPIRDTDCDFRLIRRAVFRKVKLFETSGTICVELVKKIDHYGYTIAEVPVHHFWRTSGRSQFFNFQKLKKTALNLFALWWKLIVKKEYEK